MEKVRCVEVDVRSTRGENKKIPLQCVSAARAGLLLRRDHQEHLKRAVRECGFRYLRFHGLFQKDLGVYRETADGEAVYSWLYADQVYDFLLEIGLRPFVVFDFMPEALAGGEKTVYWEKANVSLPSSCEKWERLIFETVRHFTERYGRREVEQWYFEVLNEPDNPPFFDGGFEDYCRLYRAAASAVKRVCETYRVGGPAVAGRADWVEGLIRYCADNGVPIDFVSAHSYASVPFAENGGTACRVPGLPCWEPGPSWELGNQRYDPRGLTRAVEEIRAAVSRSPMPELAVHFTEWGLSWDYWDPLRDSYHAASFLLSRLHEAAHGIASVSYCEVSDIFEEDGPPTEEFHGGFGLLNAHGIRKPAYFAYRFLTQLGKTLVETRDSRSIACTENGSLQVLFWDDSVRQDAENKAYYSAEHPALPAGSVRVSAAGLSPGRYLLRVYAVGYERNDAVTMYRRMKRGSSLTREQLALLDSVSGGAPYAEQFLTVPETDAPCVLWETQMRENDVFLLVVQPY